MCRQNLKRIFATSNQASSYLNLVTFQIKACSSHDCPCYVAAPCRTNNFLENLFVQVNHALGNLNLDYFFKLVHITPAMHFVHHLVRPEVKVD